MRRAIRLLICGAAIPAALLPSYAVAQTTQELIDGFKDTKNVLNYGMGYNLQRFSALDQINKETVKNLRPVWAYSLENIQSQESQPLVYNGVLYISTEKATMAVDAKTGRQIWKVTLEYAPETYRMTCCGNNNRGVALFDGKVFRTTLDNRVIAYDAKSGKELWSTKAAELANGYSMTVAPLVVDGIVIVGNSGAEYGTRGFIDGYDAQTGKRKWRTNTVPCPGETGGDTWPDGDACKHGGGSAWLTGSYDPELNTVYWGVGNAGSWNPVPRPGDNLYTSSVLALDPKTGKIKWHYQFSPNDGFDFDATNEMVLATIPVEGKARNVILHADRNGFFYVLDRADGKLLAANPFVPQNWAKEIDMKTGKPVRSDLVARYHKGETVGAVPGPFGGKNWSPMSFNPDTGLAYINTHYVPLGLKITAQPWKAGALWFGVELGPPVAADLPKGDHPKAALKAIDPISGEIKWAAPEVRPRWGATMATKGGIVFDGRLSGEFEAFDADTGKVLWSFQTGSGIEGQPVTWEADGVQYVAVTSGYGGVYSIFAGDEELKTTVPKGGMLWVFALPEKN
jgi:alcohol dehydrogenase (cytochrome c)